MSDGPNGLHLWHDFVVWLVKSPLQLQPQSQAQEEHFQLGLRQLWEAPSSFQTTCWELDTSFPSISLLSLCAICLASCFLAIKRTAHKFELLCVISSYRSKRDCCAVSNEILHELWGKC